MTLLSPAFADPAFKWDEKSARHLLNRAGFGVPPAALTKILAMKPEEAVSAFVDYERYPDVLPRPDWLPEIEDYQKLRVMAAGLSEDEKRKLRQEKMRGEREVMSKLQMWWIDRMCRTPRPLEEKMTLFWHGHFAVSAQKVQSSKANFQLNDILRKHATGDFRKMVTDVGQSAAMLQYLDNQQNVKGKPNENWARELLELFTLGIGNYTEEDIKEAARAFTGWAQRAGIFQFLPRRHDDGQKTVFGKTGTLDGYQVIDLIFQKPACAEFICKKLWTYFAYENPEPEIVKGLAETFRASNYKIKPVLRQMFSSQAFYSPKAVWTQIKSPAQVVVNLLVQLEAPLNEKPPIAQVAMRAMGQQLFYPPNVKGWDGGKAWINTNTLLIRCNFASYLVSGVVPEFEGRKQYGGGLKKLANKANGGRREMMMDDDEPMMQESMAGESGSMSIQADDDMPERLREGPAGQDAMANDIPGKTLTEAMKKRREGVLESRRMAMAPFNARAFFARFEGMTAEEIVDSAAEYFIGFRLEGAQRQKLIYALAQGVKPGMPVPVMKMAEEDLRATIQLLLSTAEYQLC